MGYTLREASEELGVKYSTLKTWAWENDIKFQQQRDQGDYLPKAIEYDGREYTVTDLAKEFGLPRSVVSDRLRNGWSIEDAISKPLSTRITRAKSVGRDREPTGDDPISHWLRRKWI